MFFQKKLFFFILLILIAFGFGFWVGEKQVICPICPPQDVDPSLFWQTWQELHENYVDKSKLNTQKMIYGAIKGMVNSIGDPYTAFFNPEEAKTFLEDVNGQFEGVGMEIGLRNNELQVIAPLEDTPAKRAGLMPGDKIIKINDTLTSNITIEEAVKIIRGPKGTFVTLSIMRKGWDSPKEFKIKRDTIKVPSLKLEFISSKTKEKTKDGDIAYLKIYEFTERLRYDFPKAALTILNSPARKIILDLRGNPGGYLEVAQYVSGWFLEKGNVVVIEDFGGKKENEIYKANGNGRFADYPIVVLIDGGSASASEILAAALRDNRSIKLIGEKSYGKGSVQELRNLQGGSTLKVTIAYWLTPKGDQISEKGLEPDITVEMSEEDYNEGRDPQLEKAIELIKGI